MRKTRKISPPRPAPSEPAPAPIAARAPIEWRRHLLVLAGLFVAALAVYSNSFQSGMVFDNGTIIQMDPRIRAATSDNLQQIFAQEYWYPSLTTGLYRPLTTLSFLLNYAVLGNATQPAGYHVVNLLLHWANIAVIYFLAWLLFEELPLAAMLAALWALHPLLTESVTNIVGRADELAAFGVFAGLLCHIQAGSSRGARKMAWLVGLAVAAAIGVFSKESGAMVVGAMLCYDVAFVKSRPWKPRVAGYLALVPGFIVFLVLRSRMLEITPTPVVPFVDNPIQGAGPVAGALTAAGIVGRYVWLYLWPWKLSCDYSYNQIPIFNGSFAWGDIVAILGLLLCLAAALLAYRAWRAGNAVPCFAIAFFFVTLAPTSNAVLRVGSIMAERWMYLPSLGLAFLVVWGARELHRRLPHIPAKAWWAAAGALCLLWGVRGYVRNFDWRDERSIWQSAADASLHSYKAPSILATLLSGSDLDGAIRNAERATTALEGLDDFRNIAKPYAIEGMCYRMKGESLSDAAQSRVWYEKAAQVLQKARRLDLAERDLLNRVNAPRGRGEILTGLALLYLELARAEHHLGQMQSALDAVAYGRALSPMTEFSEEKSLIYRDLGDNDRAATALLEGMVLDPRSRRLVNRVIQLYKQTAADSCAIQSKGATSSFNPQCPLVHNHLCAAARNVAQAYRETGKMDQSLATARYGASALGCPAAMFQ